MGGICFAVDRELAEISDTERALIGSGTFGGINAWAVAAVVAGRKAPVQTWDTPREFFINPSKADWSLSGDRAVTGRVRNIDDYRELDL